MEHDEWIKFGRALYESRSGNRKDQVLERYKVAWTAIHHSLPPLDDGAPVNFLRNPQYTVSNYIPWFDQAKFPPENTQPPSTSPSSPSNIQLSVRDVLVSAKTNIVLQGRFPCIRGGLNQGFTDYLTNPEKPLIRVIFILDPNFKVNTKGPDAYCSTIVTHPNDAQAVMQEMEGCMSLSKDQKGCKYPQKRYFCMSWVCIYMLCFLSSKFMNSVAAQSRVRAEGDVEINSTPIYELGEIQKCDITEGRERLEYSERIRSNYWRFQFLYEFYVGGIPSYI